MGNFIDRYIQKRCHITIKTDAAISAAVDILGLRLIGIAMPNGFDGASLGFQVDPGDGTFRYVFDSNGVAYSVACSSLRYILLGWDSAVANTPGGAAPIIAGANLKVVSNAGQGETADREIILVFEQLPD